MTNSARSAPQDYCPPPLPPTKAGLAHAVIPGTAVFFIAWLVLLFNTSALREANRIGWLYTCLAGWVLGILGLAVYSWQRRAARRGSRGASAMALDEDLSRP